MNDLSCLAPIRGSRLRVGARCGAGAVEDRIDNQILNYRDLKQGHLSEAVLDERLVRKNFYIPPFRIG